MFKSILFFALLLMASTYADVPEEDPTNSALFSPQPTFGSFPRPGYTFNPRYYRGNQIPILRQNQDISPNGDYQYSYYTGDGISVFEQGGLRFQRERQPSIAVQGGFSYTSPEGIPISVTYTADENGFRPRGTRTGPPFPYTYQKSFPSNKGRP